MDICDYCEQDFAICRDCNSTFCSICKARDDVDAALCCDSCTGYGEAICFGCVSSDNEECVRCLGLFFPRLKARNDELGNEIGGLCDENEAQKARHAEEEEKLRRENEDLQKEVDDLRKQLSEGLGILG